jgi:hypothetical protein
MSISPFVTSYQDPRQAAKQLRRAPTAAAIAAATANTAAQSS